MPRFRSALLALAAIPGFLIAQVPPDSQPFHRGQWAMQFGGGSDLFSLGVLLFTSPRSAWLLDFSNSVTVLDGELIATAVPDTTSSD